MCIKCLSLISALVLLLHSNVLVFSECKEKLRDSSQLPLVENLQPPKRTFMNVCFIHPSIHSIPVTSLFHSDSLPHLSLPRLFGRPTTPCRPSSSLSLSFIMVSSSDRAALLCGSPLSRAWRAQPWRQPRKMKVRERGGEGERGIGQHANEGGETREQERKTKRSHALLVELSLASTFQSVCARVCVWWVTLGTMALCLCVWVLVVLVNISADAAQKLPDKKQILSFKYSNAIFITFCNVYPHYRMRWRCCWLFCRRKNCTALWINITEMSIIMFANSVMEDLNEWRFILDFKD